MAASVELNFVDMRLSSPYNRLLMPVYVPSLLMSTSQMALLILLPLHIVELGYSAAFAATIVGLRGVGMLLFDVPAGMLVARFGDKPVLLGGLALILVGTVLLAISHSPLGIAASALLLGAGFAAWMLGRQSYIADTCENREVGRAIAGMAGLQRVGIFIGPASGAVLAASFGFQFTFLIGAAIAAVAGLFVWWFTENVEHRSRGESVDKIAMTDFVRSHARIFATAGMVALTLQLMRGSRQLLVPLFGQAAGLSVVEIGTIYSLSAGIDMSLFYPVGLLVDRKGRKWSAFPSIALFALGLLLLPMANSYYSLLSASLLLGFANGIGTGIVMIIGADLAQSTAHRGHFLGIWRLIGDVGMSAAPLISGVLVTVASLSVASLVVSAAGFIGAVVVLILVPETLRPPGSAAPPSLR
jgi:MFS family permease